MNGTLLDTNLLARCIQSGHPLHQAAVDAMNELSARREPLFIVPQIIYEYFVVCTRPPTEYGGLGLTNAEAIAEVARLGRLATLLDDVPAIYTEWLRLVGEHKIVGKRGHDARIAAAMNVHGLKIIATFNGKDFVRYSELQLLSPEELAGAWFAQGVSI